MSMDEDIFNLDSMRSLPAESLCEDRLRLRCTVWVSVCVCVSLGYPFGGIKGKPKGKPPS